MRRPPFAAFACTCAGLLAVGELSVLVQWCTAVVVLVMALRFWLYRPLPEGLGNAYILLSLTGLTAMGVGDVQRASEWLALALLVLQIHRMWQWVGPKDSRVLVLLSLVQLVLTGSQSASSLFLLAVVLWFASAVHCFWVVPIQRRNERILTVGASCGIAVLLFLILPRFQSPAMEPGPQAESVIGFSEDIELGELSALLENSSPVLRVQGLPKTEEPLYFRGVALDAFDGERWSRTGIHSAVEEGIVPSTSTRIDVFAEREHKGVVFTLGTVHRVQSTYGMPLRDNQDNWVLFGATGAAQYTMYVTLDQRSPTAKTPRRYQELPDDVNASLRTLAAELGAGERDPTVRAQRLKTWFLNTFSYTRIPETDAKTMTVDDFVLQTRRGHCEYFASATALLLRLQGTPARVVTGFLGGEYNETGRYWVVRQDHAHAWVEYVDASGAWVRLDTTPQSVAPQQMRSLWAQGKDTADWLWRTQIVAYDRERQWTLAQSPIWSIQNIFHRTSSSTNASVFPWVGVLISLVIVLGCVWGVRRLWMRQQRVWLGERGRKEGIARIHEHMWTVLKAHGHRPRADNPPLANAGMIAESMPESAEDLYTLVWLHYRVAYGGEEEAGLIGEAEACLARIQAALKQ